MSNLEKQIRVQLVKYLRGEQSLSELRIWLAPKVWGFNDSTDAPGKKLAYEVALLMDEYGYGHWTEGSLRKEVSKLLTLATSSSSAKRFPKLRCTCWRPSADIATFPQY